jgi:Mus7/MMS22 family
VIVYREKELQRQRKRRDMERARREAEGLGDSDPDEPSGAVIRPGQSKTLRFPHERSAWNVGNEESDEVIDLTSDRESLDNDDVVVAENRPDELSSDDEIGWVGRHDSADPMDFEAMEDNTFIDGSRSRSSNPSGRLVPRRRGPINRRDPYRNLRQSRIDRMLNSTSGTRRKSKHSKGSKTHHGSSSRGGEKASFRVVKNRPLNAYIIPAHPHVHIQSRLPFEPIQQTHVISHQSRGKSDKRSSDKNSSSKGKSATSALNGFAELFDVLASRNPPSKTKLSTVSRPAALNPPSSKDASFKAKSRPTESTASGGSTAYSNVLPYGDSADPDAKIEISLNSALAFGMRRHRQGFSFGPSSWLVQGKLLDLVRVLCGTSEPARPLPCNVSTLRFDATTSIVDLQLQFPTVCDLIFASVEKPSSDEDNTNVQQLMRFMCLFVSWSVIENEEDAKGMLEYVATQIRALMDRVEEYLLINGRSGKDFDYDLLSIHWFAVEISNRITKATASIKQTMNGDVIILNDAATDRYTIALMARLLEFGIRRAMVAFQKATDESRQVERPALELWIALVHVTVLQPTTLEESRAASSTFWRLVESSLDKCGRQFASAVHETEFMFATIFSLCSLSSVDALGTGQESRILHGYWPIVCRALSNIELSPDPDKSKRLSQSTLAAKDTYIGMLFARCNVLAFRWDWSLQDPQEVRPLFELLRAALKDRKFMNLLHEQSDFPYFITRRNLRQLHEFDAKDSIQTIVIKLMLKKVEDAKEDMKSAKKWISLLASTSALEFTREKPPTQKELSTLFNQFTIKFVLLYVNPDVNNARAVVSSSKKIVNFQNADHRSRMVCIRSAMIFGRFCRHFRLPLDEVVHWMSEMGVLLLDEHRLLGVKATTHQKRETSTLCALLLGSLRDVLQTDLLDDVDNHQELATPLYLENSISMLGE